MLAPAVAQVLAAHDPAIAFTLTPDANGQYPYDEGELALKLNDGVVVLISDVDEVPARHKVRQLARCAGRLAPATWLSMVWYVGSTTA